ncbi:SDR family NAD(P)-dependent oxidoreductase [Ammoniphilus sp. 3BR4]|uniref:SDR family NAD(P)-dependent oxidoreductase n=1 Tax=Ammoniphilus sp. 3BR4 TaxID=3158265 RepID=UPI003465ED7B
MTRRNVVVVGGAAGIGKQIVMDMVRQGDRVAILDLNIEAGERLVAELVQQGGQVSFFQANVSSWDHMNQAIQETLAEMERIDVLVYSAGITRRVNFDDLGWDEWKKTISVNLTGLFYAVKAVVPSMMEHRSGKIVIIGSGSAITGSGGGVHYATSKGGAFGLMRSLAGELGAFGIRINTVAPRVIESEMLTRLYPDPSDLEALKDTIPVKRLGTLGDISNTVQFLSSEQSDYIHGQVILCDGGRTYSAQ